jgi:hypothetical protein
MTSANNRKNSQMNMDEQNLIELSNAVDLTLMHISETFEVGTLNLSAIILARLMVLSHETDTNDDFIRLLASVVGDKTMQVRPEMPSMH